MPFTSWYSYCIYFMTWLFLLGFLKIEDSSVSKYCHITVFLVAINHFLSVNKVCLLTRNWAYLKTTFFKELNTSILHIRCIHYHSAKLKGRTRLQDKAIIVLRTCFQLYLKAGIKDLCKKTSACYKPQCKSYIRMLISLRQFLNAQGR